MTKPNSTAIAIVLDRSGSMGTIADDTVGGFNAFVEEQKKVENDDARLTLVQFSSEYEVTYNARPIAEVEPLTRENYRVGGNTALLDAMGKAITDLGQALAALSEDERPEAVVFVVITDGHENSSREFTKDQVSAMIKHQTEKYNWQFVFLGANFDAVAAGSSLGVRAANAMTFTASTQGMDTLYRSLSSNVSSYRGTKRIDDLSFSAAQRDENANPDAKDSTSDQG